MGAHIPLIAGRKSRRSECWSRCRSQASAFESSLRNKRPRKRLIFLKHGGSYTANRGTEVATQRMLVAMQISSVCIRIFPPQQRKPHKRLIFLKHGRSYPANRGTEVATQRVLVAMQISSVCIRIFASQHGPRKGLLFLPKDLANESWVC